MYAAVLRQACLLINTLVATATFQFEPYTKASLLYGRLSKAIKMQIYQTFFLKVTCVTTG